MTTILGTALSCTPSTGRLVLFEISAEIFLRLRPEYVRDLDDTSLKWEPGSA